MTAATRTQIPGYVSGTWDIDPVHSDVSFTVRHMMVSKVRGRFGTFSGEIVTGPDLTASSVTATIEADSIQTGNEQRDGHIRSADFFDVENHPRWTFRSTGVRAGFSATTTIDRNDFGVDIKMPMDGGGVVVGDKVQISREIEAVLRQS